MVSYCYLDSNPLSLHVPDTESIKFLNWQISNGNFLCKNFKNPWSRGLDSFPSLYYWSSIEGTTFNVIITLIKPLLDKHIQELEKNCISLGSGKFLRLMELTAEIRITKLLKLRNSESADSPVTTIFGNWDYVHQVAQYIFTGDESITICLRNISRERIAICRSTRIFHFVI